MRVKKLSANRRVKGLTPPSAATTTATSDEDRERTSSSDWSSGSASPVPTPSSSSSRRLASKRFAASPTDPSKMDADDVSMDENENDNDTSDEHEQIDSWRDRVDRSVRAAVHAQIVEYLKALKPHAPAKVLEKLPGLADRMEQALWALATSEREYADERTLAPRLAQIQQRNAQRALDQAPKTATRLPASRAIQNRQPLSEDQARVVFACLQSWRQRMVNLFGAAPSEVAPNATLAKLSLFVPATQQDLLACGVTSEQAERFGPSLLQEMQKIGAAVQASANVRSLSPLGFKRGSPKGAKRDGKKRKTSPEASPMAPSLPASLVNAAMRLNQSNFLSPSNIMSSVALLARASEAMPSSGLPVLLPSATLGRNAFGLPSVSAPASSASSTSSSSSRVSPNGGAPSLFSRFPVGGSEAADRMHLLAHEAGQLSKQEQEHAQAEAKLRGMFEQEIYALRRRLEESEDKRAALEAEVRELREQSQLTPTDARH